MECFKALIVLTLAALVFAEGDLPNGPIFLDGYAITKEPKDQEPPASPMPPIFLDGHEVTKASNNMQKK